MGVTKMKRLLVLGGYGNTGRILSRLLLQEAEVELVIAGRDAGKAQAQAAELNASHGAVMAGGLAVDAADREQLRRAFSQVDMVVVTSSTADYTALVVESAIEAGIDYFDVIYSTKKMAILQRLAGRIKEHGLCFITDGGFHPGLPAALIRHLAGDFSRLEAARVGSVIKIDWSDLDLAPSTMDEFVGEFMDFRPLVFREGAWQQISTLSMMKPIFMDFSCGISPDFGRQYCVPMFLEEMRAIPRLFPDIQETGFYVGGFNWFVDWLVSPLIMVALNIWPRRAKRPMGKLMLWGLETFGKPPYGTLLKAEVRGDGEDGPMAVELVLFHEDGYFFTAVPAAACLLQHLDGSIRRPGLWLQAAIVETARLMADMERMGIRISLRVIDG